MKEKSSASQQIYASKPVITEEEEKWLSSNGFPRETPSPTPFETSGADELHRHIEEILDLQQTLLEMLADAAHDGVDHGYRGKWRIQSFDTHLDHAIMHLLALKYPREGDKEKHLDHAAFRIAAAGVMELIELEENNDNVNRWESEGGATMGRSKTLGNPILRNIGDVGRTCSFEHGQVTNHPSGLGVKQPRVDGYYCSRCGGIHPAIEPYACPRIVQKV